MDGDEIARYLDALQREDCYRVDEVLKESSFEVTQKVSFIGANGAESGPYIRKFIKRESGMGSAYERLFQAQQAGRRFVHLPRVIECYNRDDQFAVVMEYVQGETLQDYVRRAGSSSELAQSVFPPLCDAVSELHEGFDPPLIHRDLKPSNIVISQGGLTIIDFGIAREYKEGADADTVQFGTRRFAPPEQYGFGQTTVRSDVYSLGMVLYFCLTQTIPAPSIREAGFSDPCIPEPLRDVIVQATSFAPDMRFSSARALKTAFLAASSSEAPHPGSHPGPQHDSFAPPQPASSPNDFTPAPTPHPMQQEPVERYRVLGIVWNAFLITLTVGAFAHGVFSVGNPAPDFAQYSLFHRIILLGFLTPVAWMCITYLIMDKRRLASRFAWMRKVRWWHVVIGYFVLLVLAAILLYAVEGPMG